MWLRTRLAAALAALVLVAGAAGCSDGDDEPPGGGSASTPSSTGSTFPSDPRRSPETLTEALLVLWLDRDRAQADRLGSDAAMDALFAVAPPEELPALLGCNPEAQLPNGMTCVARGAGTTVVVTVQERADSWQATSARAHR